VGDRESSLATTADRSVVNGSRAPEGGVSKASSIQTLQEPPTRSGSADFFTDNFEAEPYNPPKGLPSTSSASSLAQQPLTNSSSIMGFNPEEE
jgi:hypothetical protein